MDTVPNHPDISVVVPVRNRRHLICRTLDSIAAQTFRPFRLVLVDNGSDDGTLEYITAWAGTHHGEGLEISVFEEPKPGASVARNRGLAEVSTEYVMFFDSDDEMRSGHLQRIADELSARPDLDVLRWPVSIIDGDGWLEVKDPHYHDEMFMHILHSTLSTQRFVVRTALLREVGGWNESLVMWNDFELGCRLLLSASKCGKLHGEPQVVVHSSGESLTGADFSSRSAAHSQALDAVIAHLTAAEAHRYLPVVAAKRAVMAAHYRREGHPRKSQSTLASAMSGLKRSERLKVRAAYFVTRYLGRGGCAVATALLGSRPPKE